MVGENNKNNEKENLNEAQNGAGASSSDVAKNSENPLEQKIVELEEKFSKTSDQLLRALAELENTRRRSREELEKTSKYAVSNFVSELVLPVETFFLLCDNAPKEQISQSAEVKHFADAVDMTRKELVKILEKNQIKRVFPLGEKFNHNLHEAIAHIESDKPQDEIVQVIQAGYTIGERLLRPALVGVSKGK